MNLKQKALIQTLKLVATGLITGVVVGFVVSYVSTQVLIYAAVAGLLVYMFYIVYKINLSQLEYREKLQEMVDQNRG